MRTSLIMVPIVSKDDWPWLSKSKTFSFENLIWLNIGWCCARDRHPNLWPESDLRRSILYCRVNSLRLRELYLLPVLPCCARPNSILVYLNTSKNRYLLWITAELCLQGGVSSMRVSGHACVIRWAQQTKIRQTKVRQGKTHGIIRLLPP